MSSDAKQVGVSDLDAHLAAWLAAISAPIVAFVVHFAIGPAHFVIVRALSREIKLQLR